MRRRDFVRMAGIGAAATTVRLKADATVASVWLKTDPTNAAGRPLMKVGTQHGNSDAILRVLAALGVNHICSTLPSARFDQTWSVEGLTKLRERVESFGIALDMVPLPLSS